MNDELVSDYSRGRQEILMRLAAHSQYFSPVDSQYSLPVEFTRWDRWLNIPARWGKYIIRPLSYICPLIRNILRPLFNTLEEDKRFWCVWLPIHNIFRPLIHNILCPLSSPVEIVDSISLPRWGKYIIRPLSLETDARFVFELDKEWGSMPPDK